MKDDCVQIVAGEPTPLQRCAWERLWSILLSPGDKDGPDTEGDTATGLENANAASGATESGVER